jgi:hypothetical protein
VTPGSRARAGIAAALLAAAGVQIWAGLALLGLQADGAYCVRAMLTGPGLACIEPARRVVQIAMEAPALGALLLGLRDLHAVAVIFSLSLQLLPLLLTALACALAPGRQPRLMVLPLIAYFAGSSAVASIGMNEGPSAAAWFWVMFYALLRAPERRGPMTVLAVGAALTLFAHEAMALLSPILAAAAWWRGTQAGRARPVFRALAGWFAVVTAVQWCFVVWPHNAANRDGFVRQMLALQFLAGPHWINVPGAVGLCAGGALLAAWRWPRIGGVAASGFAVVCALLLAGTLAWPDTFLSPGSQFFARDMPAILSLPLAAIAMLEWRHARVAWPAAGRVIATLAAATLLYQLAQARAWAQGTDAFRMALQGPPGIVAWEDAVAAAPPAQRAALMRMNWGWTMPDLSIMLSEGGDVRRLVRNPKDHGWQPWSPDDRATWPAGALFAIRAPPTP